MSETSEKYVQELLKGKTQRQAYMKAYPHSKQWKETSVDASASTLFNIDKVKTRYNTLLEKFRASEQEKSRWTREEAIRTLKYVIDKNKQDVERINEAAEDELELLAAQVKKEPHKAEYWIGEMIKKRKARRISGIHNGGIVSAVAELNKMQGYNEENINVNGVVNFVGEEELED